MDATKRTSVFWTQISQLIIKYSYKSYMYSVIHTIASYQAYLFYEFLQMSLRDYIIQDHHNIGLFAKHVDLH